MWFNCVFVCKHEKPTTTVHVLDILISPPLPTHSSNLLPVMKVIIRFTTLALSAVSSPVQVVSPPVASAWLFVCRQLYKTGEGLLAMEESELHLHVARAWKTVREMWKEGGRECGRREGGREGREGSSHVTTGNPNSPQITDTANR